MALETKNKISLPLILLFVPVAFASYLFHEFGHWFIGEILGNDMAFSLNYVWPKSGEYIAENHKLYSSIGGPLFTLLLCLLSLLFIELTRSIYFYPIVFFQFFVRFFSLVFGGFRQQDEASIAILSGLGKYTVAIFVILILLLAVWRASHILQISLQKNGLFFAISTASILLVIGTYELFLP